jgi:hypothetical protein
MKISKRFAGLEKLSDSEDINGAWENIKWNIKISATESLGLYELKQHKSLFDEKCLLFLRLKEAGKMRWIHEPSQSNVDNLNNVRRDASRHFRNKKKAYLKAKIDEIETYSKIKNIRDLYRSTSDFKKAFQLRTNIVKDERGDLVTYSHSIECTCSRATSACG